MNKIKAGDRIQIIRVCKNDAYYSARSSFCNSVGTVVQPGCSCVSNYFAGRIKLDNPILLYNKENDSFYFYRTMFRRINGSKRSPSSNH